MINWIQKDLASVTRGKTPWVIGVGHKLIYCYDPTVSDNAECVDYARTF